MQRMFNLFKTNKGSEPLFPNYGIDINVVYNHPLMSTEDALKYAVADACNPDYIYGVNDIENLDVSYSGGVGTISLKAIVENNTIDINVKVGE